VPSLFANERVARVFTGLSKLPGGWVDRLLQLPKLNRRAAEEKTPKHMLPQAFAPAGKLLEVGVHPEAKVFSAPAGLDEPQLSLDLFIRCEKVAVVAEAFGRNERPTGDLGPKRGRRYIHRALELAHAAHPELKLYGMFILEGDGRAELPAVAADYCGTVLNASEMARGLPHVEVIERVRLLSGFLGAVTLRAICDAFGVDGLGHRR
jgi:hypothetical protein